MPDLVLSNINVNQDNSDYVIDAGKVIKKYKYTTNKFSFTLDMKELTGNSNFGDMSLALNLSTVGVSGEGDSVNTALAFTSISDFTMKLVSVISLNIDSLALTNFETRDGYKWFKLINMDDVLEYISNYSYGVDMIFENGQYKGKRTHSVTFVKMMAQMILYLAVKQVWLFCSLVLILKKKMESIMCLMVGILISIRLKNLL